MIVNIRLSEIGNQLVIVDFQDDSCGDKRLPRSVRVLPFHVLVGGTDNYVSGPDSDVASSHIAVGYPDVYGWSPDIYDWFPGISVSGSDIH